MGVNQGEVVFVDGGDDGSEEGQVLVGFEQQLADFRLFVFGQLVLLVESSLELGKLAGDEYVAGFQ